MKKIDIPILKNEITSSLLRSSKKSGLSVGSFKLFKNSIISIFPTELINILNKSTPTKLVDIIFK